jgi:hypothetical protein
VRTHFSHLQKFVQMAHNWDTIRRMESYSNAKSLDLWWSSKFTDVDRETILRLMKLNYEIVERTPFKTTLQCNTIIGTHTAVVTHNPESRTEISTPTFIDTSPGPSQPNIAVSPPRGLSATMEMRQPKNAVKVATIQKRLGRKLKQENPEDTHIKGDDGCALTAENLQKLDAETRDPGVWDDVAFGVV